MMIQQSRFLRHCHWIGQSSLGVHCVCYKELGYLHPIMHQIQPPVTTCLALYWHHPPLLPAPAVNIHFENLPRKILHAVFDKLCNCSLIKLTALNRNLRQLIVNGPFLWREFHKNDLDIGMLSDSFELYANKYFKDGRLLQYANLDFMDSTPDSIDELAEIDALVWLSSRVSLYSSSIM